MQDTDTEFEDSVIESVKKCENGWQITETDGWSLFVPSEECPIPPKPGMEIRLYGEGIGRTIRGIVIDGHTVFYRTPEEQEIKHTESCYGKDVADYLARWDANESVWTVEMGGLGPGYEQALQVAFIEALRGLVAAGLDPEDGESVAAAVSVPDDVASKLGLSGSQDGAARQLAFKCFTDGPSFARSAPSDRRIQVSNRPFPRISA